VINASFALSSSLNIQVANLTLRGRLDVLSGASVILNTGGTLALDGGLFDTSNSGGIVGALQGSNLVILVSNASSLVRGSGSSPAYSASGKPFGASSNSRTLTLKTDLTIQNTSLPLTITPFGGMRSIFFSGLTGIDVNTSVRMTSFSFSSD
jgi:hypothetical protein